MTTAIAAAIGLLFFAVVWHRERSIRRWPPVSGEVLSSIPMKRPVRLPLYRTTVGYSVREGSFQARFTLASRKAPGTTLVLRYDPAEPSDAVLDDRRRHPTAAPVALLIWVLLVGLLSSRLF